MQKLSRFRVLSTVGEVRLQSCLLTSRGIHGLQGSWEAVTRAFLLSLRVVLRWTNGILPLLSHKCRGIHSVVRIGTKGL